MLRKILCFGDSLTAEHNHKTWPSRISDYLKIGHINFAVPASSNALQIKKWQNYVSQHEVGAQDIVIWQITFTLRHHRCISNKLTIHRPYLDNLKIGNYDTHVNYFDNCQRYNLLSNFPMQANDVDEAETLEDIAYTLKVARKHTQNVLVFFGWDEVIPDQYQDKFIDFLSFNTIKFVRQSLVSFSRENNFAFDSELHPVPEAGNAYADRCLLPVLLSVK